MNTKEYFNNTKEYLIILKTLKRYYKTNSKTTKKYIEAVYDLEIKEIIMVNIELKKAYYVNNY